MAGATTKDRFDAAVKVIQSLPKNGKKLFISVNVVSSVLLLLLMGWNCFGLLFALNRIVTAQRYWLIVWLYVGNVAVKG